MTFQQGIETAGQWVDAAGVFAILVGVLAATAHAVTGLLGRREGVYGRYRRFLGRSILLGLELLVAADIIRTVAVTPTRNSVVVLAIIVVIRTFLSWSLELEISGRWPWQKVSEPGERAAGEPTGGVRPCATVIPPPGLSSSSQFRH